MQRSLSMSQANLRPLPSSDSRRPLSVHCCFMAASCSMSLSSKCPYRTLGVGYEASEAEIKLAFRLKAKQVHPDVARDSTSALAFSECRDAYQTLLDPEERAKYDKTLHPRGNKSQVLSYLNARSAARYGQAPSRPLSRAARSDSPDLYATIRQLMAQVKSCTKHLEREFISKDGKSMKLSTVKPKHAPAEVRAKLSACTEGDCGDHECSEPWIYYTSHTTQASEPVIVARVTGRRR